MDNSTVRACCGCVAVVFVLLFVSCMVRMCQVGVAVHRHWPEIQAMGAPMRAIETLMDEIESEGYIVEQTKKGEEDPSNPFQMLIEYEVSTADGSRTWTYTWAWRIPPDLAFSNDMEEILSRVDEFELIPISSAAQDVHPRLEEIMAEEE